MSKKNKIKKEEIKIFKQFKKQKIFNQVSFVFAALIVGIGINTFVFNSEFWNNLKTNLLENHNMNIEKKADLYIEKINWETTNLMKLVTWEEINNIKNISFSFTYNPEKVEVQDIFPNTNVTRLENEKWISTFIVNFEKAKTVKVWEDIINFYISKKWNESQNLNLINANFTDSSNTKYDLTTSWIIF